MKLIMQYDTRVGTFYIKQSQDGRFHPIFNGQDLGSYAKLWQASEDLANNDTISVSHPKTGKLLDTSEFGIPENSTEWNMQ